jgi:hypothetical protein
MSRQGSGASLAELAHQILGTPTPAAHLSPGVLPVGLRYGVVNNVDTVHKSVTITLAGTSTPIGGVAYASGYTPVAGDYVPILCSGPDLFVLPPFAANAGAPATTTTTSTAPQTKTYTWSLGGNLFTKTGLLRIPIVPASLTIQDVRAAVGLAPLGLPIILDLKKNGSTLYTTPANRPTIAAGTFGVVAALPDILSLASGDYLTVDIDQVGSIAPGSNAVLEVTAA